MSLSDFAELFEKAIFFITFGIIGLFYFITMWIIYTGISSKRNFQVSIVPSKKPFHIQEPITGKIQITVKKDTSLESAVISLEKRRMTAGPHNRGVKLCKETLTVPRLYAGNATEISFTLDSLDILKKKFLEQSSSPQLQTDIQQEGEGNIYTLFVELRGKKGSALDLLHLPFTESSTVIFQLEDGKVI